MIAKDISRIHLSEANFIQISTFFASMSGKNLFTAPITQYTFVSVNSRLELHI